MTFIPVSSFRTSFLPSYNPFSSRPSFPSAPFLQDHIYSSPLLPESHLFQPPETYFYFRLSFIPAPFNLLLLQRFIYSSMLNSLLLQGLIYFTAPSKFFAPFSRIFHPFISLPFHFRDSINSNHEKVLA
jgi:hypothetical protein